MVYLNVEGWCEFGIALFVVCSCVEIHGLQLVDVVFILLRHKIVQKLAESELLPERDPGMTQRGPRDADEMGHATVAWL